MRHQEQAADMRHARSAPRCERVVWNRGSSMQGGYAKNGRTRARELVVVAIADVALVLGACWHAADCQLCNSDSFNFRLPSGAGLLLLVACSVLLLSCSCSSCCASTA